MAAKKAKAPLQPSAPSSNWKNLQKTLPPASAYTKKRKRDAEMSAHKPTPTPIAPTSVTPVASTSAECGRFVALDCEFVGVGVAGIESMLARVSMCNFHGHTLLDVFVNPKERVTDYRTWVSGVREADLRGEGAVPALTFEEVQKQVAALLEGRVLVGHAVKNDLKCLMLSHPKTAIRDTSSYEPLRDLAKTKRPALRKLAQLVLGINIQTDLEGGHSSVEDARATMAIYRAHKTEWETSLTGARPPAIKKPKTTMEPRSDGHEARKQRQTLGLAASLQHARNEDDITLHNSEGVVKGGKLAQAAATTPAKRKTTSSGKGKANASEWWKEAIKD